MSDLRRYEPDSMIEYSYAWMEEDPLGDYVLYEEYEKLEAEKVYHEAQMAQKEVASGIMSECLIECHKKIEKLEAENKLIKSDKYEQSLFEANCKIIELEAKLSNYIEILKDCDPHIAKHAILSMEASK